MAICSDKEIFLECWQDKHRLLGLDIGEKTVGLALSDSRLSIATPMDTLRRKKWSEDAQTLLTIIAEQNVYGLIIGLPLNMDGTEGPRCQSVRQFAQNFIAKKDLPIFFWDERLSTVAVTRTLIEADMSRKKRGEVVDKMAAAYILQGFLDSIPTVN